jgi:Na+-transporting NADH:ubiquinone oxidoreductase subunit A
MEKVHFINKGLDIPISGVPINEVTAKPATKVAVTATDFNGMKPTMLVKLGESVRTGQPLFVCKKNPGVTFTSPGTGQVIEVNRGDRRVFQSIVIELTGQEEFFPFSAFTEKAIPEQSRDEIQNLLVESGAWTAIRTRPYSKSADLNSVPKSIFVTATDSNPLAMSPELFIKEYEVEFNLGLEVLAKLTDGKLFVCHNKENQFSTSSNTPNVEYHVFKGVHPAGNVGTHINTLSPVDMNNTAWHVGYQHVVMIGKLFQTGKIFTERWIGLAGPMVKKPRIIKTRIGADIFELLDDELIDGNPRIISGSVLYGKSLSKGAFQYLTHFSNSVSVIEEDNKREFLGWHDIGFNKFTSIRTHISSFLGKKLFNLGTNTHGSKRSILSAGLFERVFPMDIYPTHLVKSLASNDYDQAEALGCLELDEEDLALCTFVDPGKNDFGPMLRKGLEFIEKEG